MKRRHLCGGLLALAALAGCESTANLDARQAGQPAPDKAVVIFTVSHDRDPSSVFKRGANVKFFVELRDATRGQALPRVFSNMETLSPMMTSPFDDVWGRVFVREVEPGRIEFTTWEVLQDNGPLGTRVVQPRAQPTPIAFEVEAGTVTYIGNLHAELLWAKNPMRIDILAGAIPEVRHQPDRDLPRVYAEYPGLRGRVAVRPIASGPWRSEPPVQPPGTR